MSLSLFDDDALPLPEREELAPDAFLLRGFALPCAQQLMQEIEAISAVAPFRHLNTPGGLRMSVAMTNCGELGWVSDRQGYRYESRDPQTVMAWPAMPDSFLALAKAAAEKAGFTHFVPDACLINRYEIGARLTLHQDRDESDFDAPIVSVSLGIPAVFQFGGVHRNDPKRRIPLLHGDVVVWGGRSRLAYHAIAPLKEETHPLTGAFRFNLTFRKAS